MVPNMTGYNQYYYIFKDTMTEGLTVSKDTLNLVVKIGGTVVDSSEYTLTVDKTNRIFTVEFKNFYTNHAKDANESLTFTYSAVVNEKQSMIQIHLPTKQKLVMVMTQII